MHKEISTIAGSWYSEPVAGQSFTFIPKGTEGLNHNRVAF